MRASEGEEPLHDRRDAAGAAGQRVEMGDHRGPVPGHGAHLPRPPDALAVCLAMVCDELHLNDEQYGQLLAAFRWTYALTHVAAGFVADRMPLASPMPGGAGVVGGGGLSRLRPPLAAPVADPAVAGHGRGLQLALRHPHRGQPLAAAGPCPGQRNFQQRLRGRFARGPLADSAAGQVSRLAAAFVAIGGLGLLWVLLWLWITRPSGRTEGERGRKGEGEIGRQRSLWRLPLSPSPPLPFSPSRFLLLSSLMRWLREVPLQPGFWMLLLVGVSVNPCWYFLNDWIPKYLHDQRGLSQLTAGMISVPVFLAADLGNLAGGGLVKYLTLGGWSLRPRARSPLPWP